MTSINKELTDCVSKINLQRVTWLLEHNADPNYIRQASYFYKGKWCDGFKRDLVPLETIRFFVETLPKKCDAYNTDGTEKRDMEPDQPTTPLKLCVFRFSDCMLTEEDQLTLIRIAKVLIQHGAHKTEALEYFISRYGTASNKVGCSRAVNFVKCCTPDNNNTNDVWIVFYELLK
jgi:hypothetical protein